MLTCSICWEQQSNTVVDVMHNFRAERQNMTQTESDCLHTRVCCRPPGTPASHCELEENNGRQMYSAYY